MLDKHGNKVGAVQRNETRMRVVQLLWAYIRSRPDIKREGKVIHLNDDMQRLFNKKTLHLFKDSIVPTGGLIAGGSTLKSISMFDINKLLNFHLSDVTTSSSPQATDSAEPMDTSSVAPYTATVI